MKKIIILLGMIISAVIMFAQTDIKDPRAKEILDKLSEETKSYESIYAEFSFTMENQQEDILETYDGKVKIKGDKYQLHLMGAETYCDGTSIWTYMVEQEEVNITNRDVDDKSFLNNPQAIFTMYEDGFKYSLKPEITENGISYAHLELYPEKVDQGLKEGENGSNDLSKMRMLVNTEKNQIYTFTYYTKDGNIYTIKLKNIEPNISVTDSDFVFDTKKHPNIEPIDLRE